MILYIFFIGALTIMFLLGVLFTILTLEVWEK